jgi:hypothetical protein
MDHTSSIIKIAKNISSGIISNKDERVLDEGERVLDEGERVLDEGERVLDESERVLDGGERDSSSTKSLIVCFCFNLLLDSPMINAYYYIKSCKISKGLQKITLVCNIEMLV